MIFFYNILKYYIFALTPADSSNGKSDQVAQLQVNQSE